MGGKADLPKMMRSITTVDEEHNKAISKSKAKKLGTYSGVPIPTLPRVYYAIVRLTCGILNSRCLFRLPSMYCQFLCS